MALQKTPVSILQEVLTKKGTLPKFECIEKTGLQHKPMFKLKASALNVSVEAEAPTKKEAKQEAAKLLLQRLVELDLYDGNEHLKGASNSAPTVISTLKSNEISCTNKTAHIQPYPSTEGQSFGIETQEIPHQDDKGEESINGVVYLEYLCQKYQLPIFPQYTLISESGPSHDKLFTVQVVLGMHKVHATSTSKKQARQMAASKLYLYLNDKLHRIDYLKKTSTDALQREEKETMAKNEKAVKLYSDIRIGPPNVSQMSLDEYKSAFKSSIDIKKRNAALAILTKHVNIMDPQDIVEKALDALGLKFEWQTLPRIDNKETHLIQIENIQSTAAIISLDTMHIPNDLRGTTAMEAITYLKNMLT